MIFKFFQSGFKKIKEALVKTRSQLSQKIKSLFQKPLNEETLDQLEHILYEADLGTALSQQLVKEVEQYLKKHPHATFENILALLHQTALTILQAPPKIVPKLEMQEKPFVILIVGVNGSGKTTAIAKLARHFSEQGKKVLLAAADTFRAAAIEQLTTWAERLGIDIIKGSPGADPSSVAFDALQAAKARNADIVLIDTAGRLQNKTELMRELEKIRKVCQKVIPETPHDTLLVLDATSGQNALDQAAIFHQFTPLTGIIMTKLDGSAKGGILIPIYQKFGIPIRYIGVGEQAEDLMVFDPKAYVDALFSQEE